MARLTIAGRTVQVDDRIRSLPPEEMQRAIDKIASQLQQMDAAKDPGTPPPGAKPGSREYANWAAQQARTGKTLPQVSGPEPKPNGGFGAPGALGDDLFAASSKAIESVPFAGPHLMSAAENVRAQLQGMTPEQVREEARASQERNPVATTIGEIAGPTVALAPLGATSFGARALGLSGTVPTRAGMGALSSGLIFGGDEAMARGGDLTSALTKGGLAAAGGALFPLGEAGVRAFVGRALGKGASCSHRQVAKALQREGISDAATMRQRLTDLGPEGVIADLGPNLTRQASTIASLPGEGAGHGA